MSVRLPYTEYFYGFEDLPESATPEQIETICPEGARREYAYDHFRKRYPEDVRYLYGYVITKVKNSIYDDEQFDECYRIIDEGLALKDQEGCHQKLGQLRSDLKIDQVERHAELGPLGPVEEDELSYNFRTKNFAPIRERFESLKESVKPRGILGTKDEKELWVLYGVMIKIDLINQQPEAALTRLAEFEQGRIAVKLTPLPDFALQESLIGYLASQSVDQAIEKLQFWIEHSKMPIVDDLIKSHPNFRHLFE